MLAHNCTSSRYEGKLAEMDRLEMPARKFITIRSEGLVEWHLLVLHGGLKGFHYGEASTVEDANAQIEHLLGTFLDTSDKPCKAA